MSHNNPIPKADLVEGTKVVLQYDIYDLGAMWSQIFYASPFSGLGDWSQNHMSMRINTNCVQGYSAPAGSEVWINGAKVFDDSSAMIGTEANTNDGDFGLQANVLNAQKAKGTRPLHLLARVRYRNHFAYPLRRQCGYERKNGIRYGKERFHSFRRGQLLYEFRLR